MSVLNRMRLSRRVTAVLVSIAVAGCTSSSTPAVPGVGAQRPVAGQISRVAKTPAPTYAVIYDFRRGDDGAFPKAPLVNLNGTLYGTTQAGGYRDQGTVFSVTPEGLEAVVYAFGRISPDGALPLSGLVDVDGVLWGTTYETTDLPKCGVVFQVTTAGVESVKYRFENKPDGCRPFAASLVKSGSVLYGTTTAGGDSPRIRGDGVIFHITTSGHENVDYAFRGHPDGQSPAAKLTDVSGTLYGTTASGGTRNLGTVFSFSPTGGVKIIHSFRGGSDGLTPNGGLVDVDGKLYGTTTIGGTHGGGTLFSITTAGIEKVVYDFGAPSTDGATPSGDLILLNGKLYGTTIDGGTNAAGTIYSVTRTGTESVLHSFGSVPADGTNPLAGLIDVNGTLYGTAAAGGSNGDGVVYSIVP